MTTFVGKGTDIARALDNALLFVSDKAEYLPGIVHVEFSAGGIAFSACDDYATGRDRVGEVTLSPPTMRFGILEGRAKDLAGFVRSARAKAVSLRYEPWNMTAGYGDEELTVSAFHAALPWDDILPLVEPHGDCDIPESYCEECASATALPPMVAFNAARLARFGRVKGAKDAPVDIRFMGTEGAPIALVKIGPTFRGELQGVRRDEALKHMGPEGPDCFWI